MADFFDDFAPVESAPAPTGTETVSDPAADFLAAEQSDLAQIEQNVYDEVPQTQGSFVAVLILTLSGFESLNDLTLIIQNRLVTRHFANIWHHLNFTEEHKWYFS